jgi:hypothetical protein
MDAEIVGKINYFELENAIRYTVRTFDFLFGLIIYYPDLVY